MLTLNQVARKAMGFLKEETSEPIFINEAVLDKLTDGPVDFVITADLDGSLVVIG